MQAQLLELAHCTIIVSRMNARKKIFGKKKKRKKKGECVVCSISFLGSSEWRDVAKRGREGLTLIISLVYSSVVGEGRA